MMVVSEQSDGCRIQSELDRVPRAKAIYFEVDRDFEEIWGRNTIFEDGKIKTQIAFCPFDCGIIQMDERGIAACLECGQVYPVPNKILKNALGIVENRIEKFDYRFIDRIKFREPQLESNDANGVQRGSLPGESKKRSHNRSSETATERRPEFRATSRP